jgi:hypothetical protein
MRRTRHYSTREYCSHNSGRSVFSFQFVVVGVEQLRTGTRLSTGFVGSLTKGFTLSLYVLMLSLSLSFSEANAMGVGSLVMISERNRACRALERELPCSILERERCTTRALLTALRVERERE